MAKKDPEGQRDNRKVFEVPLALRHAEYIERLARQRNETPERAIEWCVRQIYAHDPYKAGAVNPSASAPLADMPPRGHAS